MIQGILKHRKSCTRRYSVSCYEFVRLDKEERVNRKVTDRSLYSCDRITLIVKNEWMSREMSRALTIKIAERLIRKIF